jgi:hypothetical protein
MFLSDTIGAVEDSKKPDAIVLPISTLSSNAPWDEQKEEKNIVFINASPYVNPFTCADDVFKSTSDAPSIPSYVDFCSVLDTEFNDFANPFNRFAILFNTGALIHSYLDFAISCLTSNAWVLSSAYVLPNESIIYSK